MDRRQLADILRGDGEVIRLCREALLRDAAFQMSHDGAAASTSGVVRIYSCCAKLIRKSEQISLGMDEAVAALKEYPGAGVHIGYVDDRPAGGYFFQLFVAPTLDSIVARLAVGTVPRRAMPS